MAIAAGRKALVAGGASGLGREIARRLVASGAQVAVFDVDKEGVRDAVDELGSTSVGVPADVRSVAEVQDGVKQCVRELGSLDTVVYSAGVFRMGPLAEIREEDWDGVLEVNLKGAFATAQAAMPHLQDSGRGRMVTIGSIAGRRGYPLQLAYTSSKFGLIGLTQSLAAEFAPDGVTVNCVCPVACPTTPMGEQVVRLKVEHDKRSADEIVRRSATTNPMGRNATESDVADAALFFISDEASFLTGIALDVAGGALLGAVPGIDPLKAPS